MSEIISFLVIYKINRAFIKRLYNPGLRIGYCRLSVIFYFVLKTLIKTNNARRTIRNEKLCVVHISVLLSLSFIFHRHELSRAGKASPP